MKKALTLLLLWQTVLLCRAYGEGGFVPSDFLAGLKADEKAALLMVHFGTTYDDTRALTIDALNRKVQETFPELTFSEAYTSRIVIRRLKQRGIRKDTPLEALLRLRAEGYTHIIVQSSNIIDGVEMESLRHDVESVQAFFKEIRVGTPLLYSIEDCEKVADILTKRLDTEASKGKPKVQEHFVLVGHGTYTPRTAVYSQMDYMLKASGHSNCHVATIEGYPTLDNLLAQLKVSKARNVILQPFMLVAGDHARNDIANEWKEKLEAEGYTVHVSQEGLGQMTEIQDIFIEHIRFSLHHRNVGIMEKKAAYAAGKD